MMILCDPQNPLVTVDSSPYFFFSVLNMYKIYLLEKFVNYAADLVQGRLLLGTDFILRS